MEEEQLPRVSVHEVFGIIAMAVEREERTEVTGIFYYRGMGRQCLGLGSALLRTNKKSIVGLKLRAGQIKPEKVPHITSPPELSSPHLIRNDVDCGPNMQTAWGCGSPFLDTA